jgi:excinuclease ABC subunit C
MSQHISQRERQEELRNKIQDFPSCPGVYVMRGQDSKILYIGKAKSLKNRVRSYFSDSVHHSVKTQFLVKAVWVVEYLVTETELEALLLEARLIKKNQPKYNIRLKDDKNYPYIRLSLSDTYPRLYLARKVQEDGSWYFGPYSKGQMVSKMIQFLNQNFKIRDCRDAVLKARTRPCLSYQIHCCTAPCVDLVTQDQYHDQVLNVQKFLSGQYEDVITSLESQMWFLAEQEQFEQAARIRDTLESLKSLQSLQGMKSSASASLEGSLWDMDIVALKKSEDSFFFETLHLRKGLDIGSRSFEVGISHFPLALNPGGISDGGEGSEAKTVAEAEVGVEGEILLSFLTQYYEDNFIPDYLVLPREISLDLELLLKQFLELKVRRKISVLHHGNLAGVSSQIPREKILELQARVQALAEEHWIKKQSQDEKRQEALEEIQKKLKLPKVPYRIECFDISHFQGYQTVGSQVVFEKGLPEKQQYRRYKVKTVEGISDVESLREVLTRRFLKSVKSKPAGLKPTASESAALKLVTSNLVESKSVTSKSVVVEPDLLLIDGGKGQLAVALRVLAELGLSHISVVGLAKARTEADFTQSVVVSTEERFYRPGRSNPVTFKTSSMAYQILIQLRDEAHRFALSYHRKLRDSGLK